MANEKKAKTRPADVTDETLLDDYNPINAKTWTQQDEIEFQKRRMALRKAASL